MIRLHPNVQNQSKKIFKYSDKIIDVTLYPDIQELLCVTDILLTDYSSCMLDYMLTEHPIFLYTKDFEKYTSERDFYMNFFDLPFPIAKTEKDLIKNIENFDNVKYKNSLKDFLKLIKQQNTCASENIVNKIKQRLV